MPTDKKILMNGLKFMGWALPMFFIGPFVIFNAFQNKNHILFIPVLGLGIMICGVGMFFMFRGLKTIVKSLTDE